VRAVFLDRDGVINRKPPDGEYIAHWSEIEFIPGSIEAVAALHEYGFKVVIVTNQRGIARGKVKLVDLEDIHARIAMAIFERDAMLSAVYYCPHDIIDHCACRKPQPGMLIDAAAAHGLDLSKCWMLGDSPSDIEAGRRARCRTALIGSSRDIREFAGTPDVREETLRLAVEKILKIEQQEKLSECFSKELT
jgi:D-glycero-D-manno-heptose 1,7-bisphosphate phosphatase